SRPLAAGRTAEWLFRSAQRRLVVTVSTVGPEAGPAPTLDQPIQARSRWVVPLPKRQLLLSDKYHPPRASVRPLNSDDSTNSACFSTQISPSPSFAPALASSIAPSFAWSPVQY